MASKTPAFQFYPGDFLSDDAVCLMTNEQVGAYIILLCHAWMRPDGLPGSLSSLAKLSRCTTARFEKTIWPAVEVCFHKTASGHWFNGRLERVRVDQAAFVERQRAAGRASAAARANTQPGVNHRSTDEPPEWQPEVNSSSSSSINTRTPPTPLDRGASRKFTRAELKQAEETYQRSFGSRCPHEPACPNSLACIQAIAEYQREMREGVPA